MKKLFALLLLFITSLFAVSKDNILALSWENSYCELHPRAKECKIRDPYTYTHFTLHGLWPNKKRYCKSQYNFKLSPLLKRVLKKYMPSEKLARHEWIKHGVCFGTDPETYFLTAIKLTQQFNETQFINFFNTHMGSFVTLQRIRFVLGSIFGQKNIRKFQVVCQKGFITEIRIHLEGDPIKKDLFDLINAAKPLVGVKQCKGGIIALP